MAKQHIMRTGTANTATKCGTTPGKGRIDGDCLRCKAIEDAELRSAAMARQSMQRIADDTWKRTGIPYTITADGQAIVKAAWNCGTCGPSALVARCGWCYPLDSNGQRIVTEPAAERAAVASVAVRPSEDGPARFRARNGKRKASRNHRRGW